MDDDGIKQALRDNFQDFFFQAFHHTHPDTDLDFEPYLQHVCFQYQNLKKRARIVINQPPRTLKSWTAKIYAAWRLGRLPSIDIMVVANTQKLAEEFAYDVRAILKSKWFRRVFPKTRIDISKSAAGHFKTTKSGSVLAVSVETSIGGFGADLLIVDDPNKIADADRPDKLGRVNKKFDGEIYSRLNNKRRKSAIIVVQHRLAETDLSGHLIAQGYKRIVFPLIATKNKAYKISDDELWHRRKGDILVPNQYLKRDIEQAQKSEKPPFFWFFQQGCGRNQAAAIKREHFKFVENPQFIGPPVISIDTAVRDSATSSFNVIQLWRQTATGFHLVDQFRAQCTYSELEDAARKYIKRNRPAAVLIENAANGTPLLSRLHKTLKNIKLHAIEPRKSKTFRLNRHRATIRSGRISLSADSDWAADYIAEFVNYPNGPSDQIDGTTQMLDFMASKPVLKEQEPRALAQGVFSNGMRIPNETNHPQDHTTVNPRAHAGLALGSRFRFRR
jgi:predicted phage terminase large subunit-like protein